MILITTFLILNVLIFIHELGHFLAAKRLGVLVEEFGIGFPPRLFSKKLGETIYSINLLPIGGFVRLYGENQNIGSQTQDLELEKRAFYSQKPFQKTVILLAGVMMNFLLGFMLIWFLFMHGNEVLISSNSDLPKADRRVVVLSVNKDSPAELAGILAGDKIRLIQTPKETVTITEIHQVVDIARRNSGSELTILIIRGQQEKLVKVIPRTHPPEGQGPLGISLGEVGFVKYGVLKSFIEAVKTSISTSMYIFSAAVQFLEQIILGGGIAGVVGPVGIVQFASSAVQTGLNATLNFVALISLNLAVFNILPIPALDGGRILFVLWEKFFRKPISPKIETYIHTAGFIFLVSLIAVITFFDIKKLI